MTKIVALDIETAPALAFTFNLYKTNIGLEQIVEDPRIMGYSWQWKGSKKVNWASEYHNGRSDMLGQLHEIMDDAEVAVHFNGKRFDVPWITGELAVEGYDPTSPLQQIDLYQLIKNRFRFISGKLDYASRRLLDDRKVSHHGFGLWRDCLIGNDEEKRKAWALMKKYGMKDTALLFPLHDRIKGWVTTGHPNMALLEGVELGCPVCASENVQRRGTQPTQTMIYPRYQCQDCGKWFRGSGRLQTTQGR